MKWRTEKIRFGGKFIDKIDFASRFFEKACYNMLVIMNLGGTYYVRK